MVEVVFEAAFKHKWHMNQMPEAQDRGWKRGFIESTSAPSAVPGPAVAAAAAPGNWWEIKIIQFHLDRQNGNSGSSEQSAIWIVQQVIVRPT